MSDVTLHLEKAVEAFPYPAPVAKVTTISAGHVNSTFCIHAEDGSRFVLQRINSVAFHHPDEVMDNALRITEHLGHQLELEGGDCERGTLHFLQTKDGQNFYTDPDGGRWGYVGYYMGRFGWVYLDDPETEFYLSKGNYIYCLFDESHLFITYDEDDPKVLVRMDHDGNDPTVLVENIDRYCLTESYVYFNYKEYKTVGTDKNGKPIQAFDSKIYRIPKTGGEPELVFEFPEEMSHYSLGIYLVDGNYLYASYGYYDEKR